MFVKRVFVTLSALFILSTVSFQESAQAVTITLTDFQAVMEISSDPRIDGQTASLFMDSRFGDGGFAGGMFEFMNAETFLPPDEARWLVDPFGGPTPDEGMPVITFNFDSIGNLSGVQPQPFRLFVAFPPDPIFPDSSGFGELDFSGATGFLGSVHLSGLTVHAVNSSGVQTGVTHSVNSFAIHSAPVPVPEPSTMLFLGSGLIGLVGYNFRQGKRTL